MQLPQMPADVAGKGEVGGSWWNFAIMLFLVLLAYLSMPLGLAIPENVSFVLAVVGIVAFFGLSLLVRQPARFLTLRTVGLLLIGGGILAGILPKSSFVRYGLELIAVSVSPERSFTVSAVLLCAGLALLAVYWMLNLCTLRTRSANNAIDVSRR